MKVVINRCHGGFGLSDKAVDACVVLGMTIGEAKSDDFSYYESHISHSNYYCKHERERAFRTDPRVISVVETLGELASNFLSKLYVVEIPFDNLVGWYIYDRNGIESIEEEHSSWP
jgi:hypothetical protein